MPNPRATLRRSLNRVKDCARVAPAFDSSGTLGRVKTTLRRCAVLTRPARSLGSHLPERRQPIAREFSGDSAMRNACGALAPSRGEGAEIPRQSLKLPLTSLYKNSAVFSMYVGVDRG